MVSSKAKISRASVDRAGEVLANRLSENEAIDIAFDALASWRAAHARPLNTMTMDLRQKVRRICLSALVVQRVKRARSIVAKLSRESSMRLTQMQDIGGCRAVVDSVEQVYKLRESFRRSRSLHEFVREDDYISQPKSSGYRGIHLVYRFKSRSKPEHDRLLFEIQLRTRTQHAWATAVETVGAVIGQALKSSEGERRWLDYFQHAGMALELLEQPNLALASGLPRGYLARKLATLGRSLQVRKRLTAYRTALRASERLDFKSAGYFLLVLLPEEPQLQIIAYSKRNLDLATSEYERIERFLPRYSQGQQLPLFPELADYSGAQAVLVGADSLRAIRESYPNYYLDTEVFLEKVDGFVQGNRRARF